MKVVIGYKLIKVPLMLALALWLTITPRGAYLFVEVVARDLMGAGATLSKLGAWIQVHLTRRVILDSALLAWLETAITTIEAVLLLLGKSWGLWLVTIGLTLFVVLELVSFEHRPSPMKLFVLAANVAIVGYLGRRLWLARSARQSSR